MIGARPIPSELVPLWLAFRRERALLRRRIRLDVQRFWSELPRQRKRFMPVVSTTREGSWLEPAPVDGLGWADELGLRLRWRFSDVMPDRDRPGAVKRIWGYDLPRGVVPSPAMLRYGKIVDPVQVETFRYFWRLLHDVHDHYVRIGRAFARHVTMEEERERRLREIEAGCAVVIGQLAADGTSDPRCGKGARAAQ